MDNIIGGTNRETMRMPKYIYVCRNTYEIIWDEKMAKDVKNCGKST